MPSLKGMRQKLDEVVAAHNVYILFLVLLMFNVADWYLTMTGVEAGILYEKNGLLEETIVKHRKWFHLLGLKTFICGLIVGGIVISQKAKDSLLVKKLLHVSCGVYLAVVTWSLLLFAVDKYL